MQGALCDSIFFVFSGQFGVLRAVDRDRFLRACLDARMLKLRHASACLSAPNPVVQSSVIARLSLLVAQTFNLDISNVRAHTQPREQKTKHRNRLCLACPYPTTANV